MKALERVLLIPISKRNDKCRSLLSMEDEEVSPLLTSTSAEHYNSSTHESAVIRRYLHSSQDCFEEEEAATIEHALTLPVGTLSTVAVSVALGLVSGTVYGFGRYSRDLKSVLDLNQYQIQQLGIFLDTGNEFPVAVSVSVVGTKWCSGSVTSGT